MAAYRNDVDALANRHVALSNEVAQKAREVADAARAVEDQKAKLRLPVLDNMRVATPCRADWKQMVGDERSRHCGECKKDVFNISEMTRAEAEALIREKNGDLCARYYQRHDGTIILKDCSIGISQKRKRRIIAGAVAALFGGGGFLAYKATRPAHHDVVMGDIGPDYQEISGGMQMRSPEPNDKVIRAENPVEPTPPVIESRTVEIK